MRSIFRIIILFPFVFMLGCGFKAPMVASPTGDGKYWVIKEDLIYEHPETGQKFIVPRDFGTDLASVPRLFWSAFPPCGKYTPAAVVHDYFYWEQEETCDRKCADRILLLAMKDSNVDRSTREIIYDAVRVGGKSAWKKNKLAKANGAIRHIPPEYMTFSPTDSWETIERRILEGMEKDE